MHKFVKIKYSIPTTAGMLVRPISTQIIQRGNGVKLHLEQGQKTCKLHGFCLLKLSLKNDRNMLKSLALRASIDSSL